MTAMSTKEEGHLPYPYGDASTDEEILARILNALYWHSGIPLERIKVEVHRGHAILSGIVAQDYERALCEHSATETSGVSEVSNLITLES